MKDKEINMKNIHILRTDKQSKLIHNVLGYGMVTNEFTKADLELIQAEYQNIYITSNEEIKEEKLRWIIDNRPNMNGFIHQVSVVLDSKICPEIILTTDLDLIKSGVQAIDDDFLEWFVKNPSCEFVNIELEPLFPMYRTFIEDIDTPPFYGNLKRKIVFPKEVPKIGYTKSKTEFLGIEFTLKDGSKQFVANQERVCNCGLKESKHNVRHPFVPKQETIEEAAKKYGKKVIEGRKNKNLSLDEEIWLSGGSIEGFIEGAKSDVAKDYWFEQFSKSKDS